MAERTVLMGTIFYGDAPAGIHIEDRALAHVKVVIVTKLRRGESFTLSWHHPDDEPQGRSTIWLHASIPLRFVFDDPEPAGLNREWIQKLADSANSTGGIMLVAEHMGDDPVRVFNSEGANASLGSVTVERLNVGRVTIAETELSGSDLTGARP